MRSVAAEIWRVLRDDGTFWLNIGDAYAGSGKGRNSDGTWNPGKGGSKQETNFGSTVGAGITDGTSLPAKNLLGLPWRVAFALQDDGWYLRSAIVWHKPNAMPEPVKDRPTSAYEMIFLLSKSQRYWYDKEAISERTKNDTLARYGRNAHYTDEEDWRMQNAPGGFKDRMRESVRWPGIGPQHGEARARGEVYENMTVNPTVNARNVWTIATQGRPDSHFATFPEELPRRCILAGCPEDGVVLDPFVGSGTTVAVAQMLGRQSVGIDLNESYLEIARKRLEGVNLPFPQVS